MSLTSFIERPQIRDLIVVLRQRILGVECKAPGSQLLVRSRTSNNSLIGTAFDYLLRFELQRRHRSADTGKWVAEHATTCGFGQTELAGLRFEEIMLYQRSRTALIRRTLKNAKEEVAIHVRRRKPRSAHFYILAGHAVRLAKLDLVRRQLKLDPTFAEADRDQVEELVELLSVVPFEAFADCKRLLLNPAFGEASLLVGGADADIISDDLLLEIKTVRSDRFDDEWNQRAVDQLLGYFILSRQAHLSNPRFPKVNRIGIYFSRYANLRTWDVSHLASDDQFLEAEANFVGEAKRIIEEHRARYDLRMKEKEQARSARNQKQRNDKR